MNTSYYQLRLVDGIIDMESNQVTYNNGYHVIEGGSFEVCHSEGIRMIVRMRNLVSAGLLTSAFVDNIETHLHIVNC